MGGAAFGRATQGWAVVMVTREFRIRQRDALARMRTFVFHLRQRHEPGEVQLAAVRFGHANANQPVVAMIDSAVIKAEIAFRFRIIGQDPCGRLQISNRTRGLHQQHCLHL